MRYCAPNESSLYDNNINFFFFFNYYLIAARFVSFTVAPRHRTGDPEGVRNNRSVRGIIVFLLLLLLLSSLGLLYSIHFDFLFPTWPCPRLIRKIFGRYDRSKTVPTCASPTRDATIYHARTVAMCHFLNENACIIISRIFTHTNVVINCKVRPYSILLLCLQTRLKNNTLPNYKYNIFRRTFNTVSQ